MSNIKKLGLEAFPVDMSYGGGIPAYDSNEKLRSAFIGGYKFGVWLESISLSHSDVPVHIKFRMYLNQKKN